jgi:hypothetical protein
MRERQSFTEASWDYLNAVSFWWWLVTTVVLGAASAVVWLFSISLLLTGALGGGAALTFFLFFLAWAKYEGETPTLSLASFDIYPNPISHNTAHELAPKRRDEGTGKQQKQPIGLFTCHVMSDIDIEVQGAFVTLESDQTGKKYRGVTDRRGSLALSVPNGSYTLVIKAKNHFDRVCAVEVSNPYGTNTQVNLQMIEAERQRIMGERVKAIIRQLEVFIRGGTDLLGKIQQQQDVLDSEVLIWEETIKKYLTNHLSKAYVTLFLDDQDMKDYPQCQGTSYHMSLTLVNHHVNKLAELIINLDEQLEQGLL